MLLRVIWEVNKSSGVQKQFYLFELELLECLFRKKKKCQSENLGQFS